MNYAAFNMKPKEASDEFHFAPATAYRPGRLSSFVLVRPPQMSLILLDILVLLMSNMGYIMKANNVSFRVQRVIDAKQFNSISR